MIHTTQAQSKQTPHERLRFFATVDALATNRDTIGLLALLDNKELSLVQRRRVVRTLANVGSYRAAPALVTALHDPDRLLRHAAAEGLGRLGEEETASALVAALADPDRHIRRIAADALGRFNHESAFTILCDALAHTDRHVRQGASVALGIIADRRAVPALIVRLKDDSAPVRAAAATALGSIGDRAAVPALEKTRHPTRHVKGQDCSECKAIDTALARLQPIRE